jgi:SpoIID/LytB domain protein
LIWGRDNFRLQNSEPVTLVVSGERRQTFPVGELNLRITAARAVEKQPWLWLGFAREGDLSGILAQALESEGWETGLWPVGVNPSSGDWVVRDYRLLARPQEGDMNPDEWRGKFAQIQHHQRAEIIELSQGQATGTALLSSAGQEVETSLPITFESAGSIVIPKAPVGEGFHWEHTEALSLPAPVWVAVGSDGKLCAGVDQEVEDYLVSVNSSEMPADSPPEFLKSQVVAARSWLLANWGSHHPGEPYTICNGDHCQCYYGPDRIREASRRAVLETSGEVLMHDRRVCDARYAKACGGVMEPAIHVWPFADEPYLGHFRDLPDAPAPDLSDEAAFRNFQSSQESSDACCSPGYAPLEGRLKELSGLYRWQEKTTLSELSAIITSKTGVDLGSLETFKPLRRGPSGRLIELEIVGGKGQVTISPELAIRKALSRTHLPSSAFWIETHGQDLTLHGMGWGHGVGLCQIGAAALAVRGWNYQQILAHYYRGTELRKIY